MRVLKSNSGYAPDEISLSLYRGWDDLYNMDRKAVEAFQLEAARERFRNLRPAVRALDIQAQQAGVNAIESLNDIVPLLFQHTHYKSYPMSLLEKGRFDMLTKWFDGLTSVDLSEVDARGCTGIDNWLSLLEAETPLQPFHTSGTTGKISFFPRTDMERDFWMFGFTKAFKGFGDEGGVKLGFDGERMPCIYPSLRYGRFVAQRLVTFMAEHVAPSPDQCYTMTNGTLSADLMSLSGRIRVAQAKGELDKFELSDSMREAMRVYLDELERRPQETDEFMQRMMDELKGKRVMVTSQTSYLVQAAQQGLARGIRDVFSSDSCGSVGGGGKGVVLPDDWERQIGDFTGISKWVHSYGMTEITGSMPRCPEGYYHAAAYHIPFVLDPETGAPLPREGRQTGRFACLDLLAQTYWGGIVSGDQVTVEWDRQCPCGRKGTHIHDTVTRYSEAVTGDDKVTCSATVDNTDAALKSLLRI
ncbi:hypothetical protein A8O16_03360 [Sphingobium sp. 20006FA]|nr:hypothetical protein A8O16_03360 [Sphingobium sp. 20006FA]